MNDKGLITTEMTKNALNFRGKYYFEITGGIEKIAEVLEQGYGVLLGFRFDYDEWTDIPVIHTDSKNKCGHGVVAVDYCLYDGQKSLIIEDSWGVHTGKGGRRIITEDFLNGKCFYAGYVTSLPNFVFTQTLRFGSRGLEVKKLQEKLHISVDGIFGKKTLEAVKTYQTLNRLVPDGIVGRLTRAVLNS
jgi:peptidoglycan hydrolase-like protein with peptidoglycan-binding domain